MPKVSDDYRASRRQQILDAAVECFARQGFHRTSMQDIFTESGLSAGAVYGYFAGKDEIVAAVADERHAHEVALFTGALAAADLRDGLHQLVHAYFDWLRDPAEQRRRRLAVQLWAEALRDEALNRGSRVASPSGRCSRQRSPRPRPTEGLRPTSIPMRWHG